MDTAVVMVQPPVQQAPPGIPPTTFRNTTQSQMSGLTPSQQAQAIANPQQQAFLANNGRPAGHQQSNPATPLHLHLHNCEEPVAHFKLSALSPKCTSCQAQGLPGVVNDQNLCKKRELIATDATKLT